MNVKNMIFKNSVLGGPIVNIITYYKKLVYEFNFTTSNYSRSVFESLEMRLLKSINRGEAKPIIVITKVIRNNQWVVEVELEIVLKQQDAKVLYPNHINWSIPKDIRQFEKENLYNL